MLLKKPLPPDGLIPVTFSLSQRDLLLGEATGGIPIAPLIDETFRAAVVRGNSVVVKMQLFEIEDLLGFIAHEANHTKNRRLAEALDEIYYPLENIFDTYRKPGLRY